MDLVSGCLSYPLPQGDRGGERAILVGGNLRNTVKRNWSNCREGNSSTELRSSTLSQRGKQPPIDADRCCRFRATRFLRRKRGVRRRQLSRTWNWEVFLCEQQFCGRDPWSKETTSTHRPCRRFRIGRALGQIVPSRDVARASFCEKC